MTPNYLNELIKETTGKTARNHIVERVLTEAKNLLFHTDMDVAMIADTLQFDEPTNFGKFFKSTQVSRPSSLEINSPQNPSNLPVLPSFVLVYGLPIAVSLHYYFN